MDAYTQPLLLLIFLNSHFYHGTSQETLKAILTLDPNTTPVFHGDTVDLKCQIQGHTNDQWIYIWRKISDGYDRFGEWSTDNTLHIDPATESQSGLYTCIARQQGHSSPELYSNSLHLTVSGLPLAKLTARPGIHVFTGESVTMTCETDSLSGWTYTWYKGINGDVVSQSQGNTFNIRQASINDEGQYWCRGQRNTRPTMSQASGVIHLLVNDLPSVRITLMDQRSTVFPGETVTLRCEINTYTGWTYKWYKDLSLNPVFESSGKTFTIDRVTKDQKGQYWCQGEKTDRPTTSEKSRLVTINVNESPAQPRFFLSDQLPLLNGQPITLTCQLESDGWQFYFYKTTPDSPPVSVSELYSYSISSAKVSDGGQYWCRAGRGDYYTHYSNPVWVNVTERPKPVVTSLSNWTQVFSGETVTLRCDIHSQEIQKWEYSWYINGKSVHGNHQLYVLVVDNVNKKDKYSCKGRLIGGGMESDVSEALTFNTFEERPQPVLRGPAQSWLTEGDSVTLSCEVSGSSAGWTFHWYKTAPYRSGLFTINREKADRYVELLPDSSRGAGGSYTLNPAALRHTGVYVCRAERGDYYTDFSQLQSLFIAGLSSASLVVTPSRSQHFTKEQLSINCKAQDSPLSDTNGNSTGWFLRWQTQRGESNKCPFTWEITLGPDCAAKSLYRSDSGTYWCESDSGEKSQAVNITVHNGNVIMDSPAYPVKEGHSLSLRCLYRTPPLDFSAGFFKDMSPLLSRTNGEMIIASVSKSDEGVYQCDNTERGISPDAWVVVKPSGHGTSTWVAVVVVLMTLLILIAILVLLFQYRKSKGKHRSRLARARQLQSQSQNSSQQNQHIHRPTHTDTDTEHIYATVSVQSAEEDQAETSDGTYAQVNLEEIRHEQKINNNSDEHAPSDVMYASIDLEAKRQQSKVEGESTNENVTYAVVNLKAKTGHRQDP
ncbi:basement membrane-specific heparan sulfate proteoglycan core protein-like [Engraulis encrasicolus]|uniref:basement membrane-specific heparan sulfate proteoglycan core protein-like n=1 Tax=Engraulis encrasicolus TaxID=184585 RepID=UPI002FD0FB83